MSTTNEVYLDMRPFEPVRGYFPSQAKNKLRELYHFAFQSQTSAAFSDTNPMLSRTAAYDAKKVNFECVMRPTMRARYYYNFSFARKLRSIGHGKAVNYPADFFDKSLLCVCCKEKFISETSDYYCDDCPEDCPGHDV